MPDKSEINVFTIDANGYKTHWKVIEGTTGEELAKLTTRQLELTQWLSGHAFKPDTFGASNGGAPRKAAQGASGSRSAPTKPQPRTGGGSSHSGQMRDPDGPLTDNQRKAIYAISKNLGMDNEGLEDWLGHMSPNDLTKAEASQVIDDLKKLE